MITGDKNLRSWKGNTESLSWELRETEEGTYNLGIIKQGNKVPMWRNIGEWDQAMTLVEDLEKCLKLQVKP